MTALVSWSVDRSGLSLSDLVIDSDTGSTYRFADGGLGRRGIAPRETFADDSPWINGRFRTSVVMEESQLPGIVLVQAASTSALETAITALETALTQFTYTVTEVKDGVTKVFTAYPATIGAADGIATYDNVAQHFQLLSISIPIYPVAS